MSIDLKKAECAVHLRNVKYLINENKRIKGELTKVEFQLRYARESYEKLNREIYEAENKVICKRLIKDSNMPKDHKAEAVNYLDSLSSNALDSLIAEVKSQ